MAALSSPDPLKPQDGTMSIEEEHLDVLQNIEFAIISLYRLEPSLLDYDVQNAV